MQNKEEEKGEVLNVKTPLKPALSPNSMDDLTVNEELPEIKENAINAVKAQKESVINKAKEDGFDPTIHAVDASGNPKLTASGNFSKKRGRKSGSVLAKSTEQKEETKEPEISSIEAATAISKASEFLAVKFINEEWAFDGEERAANISVWESTFNYYGGVNLTPPQALALNHLYWTMSRSMQPKTKSKFALAKAWIKHKFARKKKDKKNALPDSGENIKRENDIREEESPQL